MRHSIGSELSTAVSSLNVVISASGSTKQFLSRALTFQSEWLNQLQPQAWNKFEERLRKSNTSLDPTLKSTLKRSKYRNLADLRYRRIDQISDGKQPKDKLKESALRQLALLLRALRAGKANLIVDLGDSLTDVSAPQGRKSHHPTKKFSPAKKAAPAQKPPPTKKSLPAKKAAKKIAPSTKAKISTTGKFEERQWHPPEPPRPSRKSANAILTTEHGTLYPVWYATDRLKHRTRNDFTGSRDTEVKYGTAQVWIPKAHKLGEIGSNPITRLFKGDDRIKTSHIALLKAEEFWKSIEERMKEVTATQKNKHTLIFIHGYNVTFKSAAIRTAQLGADLGINGVTAFYSWPSRGNVASYPADEAAIEASAAKITQFLIEIASKCKNSKIHIIAHSMGNRGLLRALSTIADKATITSGIKFGQIMLAAPDVDREIFLQLASAFHKTSERVTLYSSSYDLALKTSKKFHNGPRAGYYTPYTCGTGFDTISVPKFNIELLGHSYFANAKRLIFDIYELINHGTAPPRLKMEKSTSDGGTVWHLSK